jgi:DNA repair exonuclease SbcCD ATPase subunit
MPARPQRQAADEPVSCDVTDQPQEASHWQRACAALQQELQTARQEIRLLKQGSDDSATAPAGGSPAAARQLSAAFDQAHDAQHLLALAQHQLQAASEAADRGEEECQQLRRALAEEREQRGAQEAAAAAAAAHGQELQAALALQSQQLEQLQPALARAEQEIQRLEAVVEAASASEGAPGGAGGAVSASFSV